MTPSLATEAANLSPWALFLQADIVVKLVMLGLLVASIWTWSIIFSHWMKMKRTQRDCTLFERDFWKADDTDGFYKAHKDSPLPTARVFQAGIIEWRRSTGRSAVDREGTRQRLAGAMGTAIAAEIDESRLQRGFDPGYLGEIDIALDLLVFGRFEIEFLNPVALQNRHPGFFRVARIDEHARCH